MSPATAAGTRLMRVITRLNIGGPARQALLLTKALNPDFETKLVVGRVDPTEGELLDDEVPLTRVPALARPLRPIGDARAFGRIRAQISDWRPRIVHSHMAKAGTIARLAAGSNRRRPLLIHTFHGHVLDGYFSKAVQNAFIRAERLLARRTDALVAVSDEVKRSLLDLGIGTEEQYRVIPLGFDLSAFLGSTGRTGAFRSALGLDDDVPLVAVVGRLVPIKDHETLFSALQRLPDVHLAVVGDGELRTQLTASVQEKALTGRVHFTGWWERVWEVYPDVDAVVLSSRNEGSPVALIEAHASGIPAVATDVGGVRSVVEDDVTGHLVPPTDPTALAYALERLLSDPARAAAMGAAGREHVRTRFARERLVSDIRALYLDLLARS